MICSANSVSRGGMSSLHSLDCRLNYIYTITAVGASRPLDFPATVDLFQLINIATRERNWHSTYRIILAGVVFDVKAKSSRIDVTMTPD